MLYPPWLVCRSYPSSPPLSVAAWSNQLRATSVSARRCETRSIRLTMAPAFSRPASQEATDARGTSPRRTSPPRLQRIAEISHDGVLWWNANDPLDGTDMIEDTTRPAAKAMPAAKAPAAKARPVQRGMEVDIEPSPMAEASPPVSISSDGGEQNATREPGASRGVGGGTREAPSAATSAPAALREATQRALDVLPYDRYSEAQRQGLDRLTVALARLQLREKLVKGRTGAASSPGSPRALSGFSECVLRDSEASSATGSAATTGHIGGRVAKRPRRRNRICGLVPPSEPDAEKPPSSEEDDLTEAAAMAEPTDDELRARGFAFVDGTYWVKPERQGWCRRCGRIDDWKIMRCEWVEDIPPAVQRRHAAGVLDDPHYPKMRTGQYGETRLYTCTRCMAQETGEDERKVLTATLRNNKGRGSVTHSLARVQQYKDSELSLVADLIG